MGLKTKKHIDISSFLLHVHVHFFLNCISTQSVFLCLPFVSSFLPFHLSPLPSHLFRPACGCCLLFVPYWNQLQLWDTAGQERFRKSMVQHYYRNVHAVLFVYDVTCPTSFSSLTSWVEECRKNSLGQEIPRWLLHMCRCWFIVGLCKPRKAEQPPVCPLK